MNIKDVAYLSKLLTWPDIGAVPHHVWVSLHESVHCDPYTIIALHQYLDEFGSTPDTCVLSSMRIITP